MADDEVMKVDQRLARLEKTVANEFYKVGVRFDKVDTQLGRLEDTVANEFHQIKKRFDEVDARFDAVDARFDSVDARLDKVDKRLDGLEVGFRVLDDKMTTGFRDIATRIDRLAPRRRRAKRQ